MGTRLLLLPSPAAHQVISNSFTAPCLFSSQQVPHPAHSLQPVSHLHCSPPPAPSFTSSLQAASCLARRQAPGASPSLQLVTSTSPLLQPSRWYLASPSAIMYHQAKQFLCFDPPAWSWFWFCGLCAAAGAAAGQEQQLCCCLGLLLGTSVLCWICDNAQCPPTLE